MKKLIALLLAALMIFGMAACGAKTEEPAPAPEKTEEPAPAPEPAPEPEPEPEPEPAEPTTLLYWAQWAENETQADVLKAAIARFEAANPEYKVEVNWAGRDVRNILRATIDSGQVIDIVESGFDQIIAQLGEEYLTDLTPYVAGSELEAAISPGMAAFSKSFTSSGDSWFFIPSQPFVGTIFYNKAIFAEAGIETPPTSWDEFLVACEKLKAAGYAAITVDDAYMEPLYGAYLGTVLGTDKVNEMFNDAASPLWNDPAILQMGNHFAELADKGYLTDGTGSFLFPAGQNTEFAMGTTAMYYCGSWLPNEVASITGPDFQWGAMFFPAPEGSAMEYTTYATGCQFFAVPRTSENPEGAVKLLAEFTSLETQKDFLETCQSIPVISGLELPENLKDCGVLMDNATNAVPWCYRMTSNSDVTAIVGATFARLLAGELTGEEFAAELDAQLN